MSHKMKRREFLKSSALAGAALPLTALIAQSAMAAGKVIKKADLAPDGVAMAYVQDATKAAKHKMFKKDSSCANCNFYGNYHLKKSVEGEMMIEGTKDKAAPCAMILGGTKPVTSNGWCQVWAKKA